MKASLFRPAQTVITLLSRPYTVRGLPGWGKFHTLIVGDYRRDWLWTGGPIKTIRGKRTGYKMLLDLSRWADRRAFFLGRWCDLEMQLCMADLIKSGDTVINVGTNRGMFTLCPKCVAHHASILPTHVDPSLIPHLASAMYASHQ